MKVLVTRTDRLGDLVLALPVAARLRELQPDWEVDCLVAPGLEAVAAAHPAVGEVLTWRDDWPQQKLAELSATIQAAGYGAVLMLQYRRELALLLRRAGMKRIFGPRSKFTSWFLLHGGLRQGRSRSGRHEMDLNLDLATALAGTPVGSGVRPPALRLELGPDQAAWGRRWRDEEAPTARRVAFIHPGSGGSALDWSPAAYAELAGILARRPGTRVYITGAAADARMVRAVSSHLDSRVGVLLERFTLSQFMGVLAQGDVLVAPSTGPLHLAAALGTATVGLFPPAPVMSPARWGQRGPGAVQVSPEVACPARRGCLRHKCDLYNCLTAILPEQVAQRAAELLDGHDAADRE